MNRRLIIPAAVIGLASFGAAACGPPPSVDALVQRTACSTTVAPPNLSACTHWVNRNAAWSYPPNTEWVGPYTDYLYDLSHGNGAELLP